MDADDIAAVIQGFRQAARYARDGGLDGVELNAGQDSLIRQFLSPLTNQRGDDYGGSLDNRLRFARQIIENARRTGSRCHRRAAPGRRRICALGPASSRKTRRRSPAA